MPVLSKADSTIESGSIAFSERLSNLRVTEKTNHTKPETLKFEPSKLAHLGFQVILSVVFLKLIRPCLTSSIAILVFLRLDKSATIRGRAP